MAIHFQEEKEMQGGAKKIIDDSSQEMMLDLVQKYQYQFPIRSTVRELASNSLDSISDREIARKILLEGVPASQFYVEREGKEFEDSKFDPGYYDFNWLGDDNTVKIHYVVGPGMERDKVVISDNGVGLGGYRLEKYFNLGYSTKRLSKVPLGKFGIGGKAALSIGEPFYTMESRYNGMKFRFNVYSHTFDSLVPPFNLNTGEENGFVVFYAGTYREMKVYYEKTEEKNGVTVTVSAKKTHKQQYIDAVKSQLLYFPNIDFRVTEEYGTREIDYRAFIIYEDDKIILSDNSYWSKPHLIINGVNYGYINFEELELEDKRGNIGIKIASTEVDINPSRESIIWNEVTKKTVLERFSEVVEIAQKVLQEELQTTDYLEWLKACYDVIGKHTDPNSVVGRLARIVDLSNVKPVFGPEPKLKFQQNKVFEDFFVRHTTIVELEMADKIKKSVERNPVKTMGNYIHLPIFLMKNRERSSFRKDKYLYSIYPNGFITIMEPLSSREQMATSGLNEKEIESMMSFFNKEGEQGKISRSIVWDYLTKSKLVQWYEELEVPESFEAKDTESDEVDLKEIKEQERKRRLALAKLEKKETQQQSSLISANNAKRRKAEGKILLYTPRAKTVLNEGYIQEGPFQGLRKAYEWQKMEVPIIDMNNWEAEEIYYSVGNEMDQYAHFAAMLSRDPFEENQIGRPLRKAAITEEVPRIKYSYNHWMKSKWGKMYSDRRIAYKVEAEDSMDCQSFFDTEVMIIKTSQANLDYMGDFLPLTSFFRQVRNNIITMSSVLVRWNTARLIKEKLDKAHFLYNFEYFNPYYAKLYEELYTYVDKNYREVHDFMYSKWVGLNEDMMSELIKLLDQVRQFQQFVASNPTPEEIEIVAKETFGDAGLKDGYAVDPDMMTKLDKVMEYVTAVGPLLNYIPLLTAGSQPSDAYKQGMYRRTTRQPIPTAFEEELKFFLEAKGVLDFGKEETDFIQFQQKASSSAVLIQESMGLQQGEEYMSEEDVRDLPAIPSDIVKPEHGYQSESNLEIPGDQAIIQTF